MCLKSRTFRAMAEPKRRRKLDVILQKMTGDNLTPYQRTLISKAIGHQRQCNIRVCHSPEVTEMAIGSDMCAVRPIFGNLEGQSCGPAAFLAYCFHPRKRLSTVYIYLPREKEECRDDT